MYNTKQRRKDRTTWSADIEVNSDGVHDAFTISGYGPLSGTSRGLFDRCYDTGPYQREIRYQEDELVPPLSPDRAA